MQDSINSVYKCLQLIGSIGSPIANRNFQSCISAKLCRMTAAKRIVWFMTRTMDLLLEG